MTTESERERQKKFEKISAELKQIRKELEHWKENKRI